MDELKTQHMNELADVLDKLRRLEAREKELRVILATLDAVKQSTEKSEKPEK